MITLYHGTSKTIAKKAIKAGILPRGTQGSNWEKYPSNNDMVYLTDTYPIYFAVAAVPEDELDELAMIEVQVDEDNLYPDEDFLSQLVKAREKRLPESEEAIELQMINKDLWKSSLEHLGNVAHKGSVRPECIKRIWTLNSKDKRHILLIAAAMDPVISVMNKRFCGDKYQELIEEIKREGKIMFDESGGKK